MKNKKLNTIGKKTGNLYNKYQDIFELSKSYLGVLLMTWWGFWSYNIYGRTFIDLTGFIITIGGLLK